jgi:hypothetical protein
MATIRPEVTGRAFRSAPSDVGGIGRNKRPPLDPAQWIELQLDGLAVVLKDAAVRLEALKKAAAQAAEVEAPPIPRPVETPAHDPGRDDPDRILTLGEASRLSSLSVDTLRRKHRNKFIQLGERRLGMRRRDALMLSE